MKHIYYALLFCFSLPSLVKAQQMVLTNEYLVNHYSLCPAYAGSDHNYEIFATNRRNWLGIEGAPQKSDLNFNGALSKKTGIGASIVSQKMGIFNALNVNGSYAYHLRLSDKQNLSFGVSAGVIENNIDLSHYTSTDQVDPVAVSNQVVNKILPDASFGMVYQNKDLNIGFASFQLLANAVTNSKGSKANLYTLSRHYNFFVSDGFNINKIWRFEPSVVLYKTMTTSLFYDINALIKFQQQIWASVSYKQNGGIAAGIGLTYNRVILHYTYEFSGTGILGSSSGSNEVSVGFLLGKNNPRVLEHNIIKKLNNKQPYQEW